MHAGQLIDNTDPDNQSKAIKRISDAISNHRLSLSWTPVEPMKAKAFESGNHPAIINGKRRYITEDSCRQEDSKRRRPLHPTPDAAPLQRETLHSGADMARGAPLVYTGRRTVATVSHVMRGSLPEYGLADGWAIMSIKVISRYPD